MLGKAHSKLLIINMTYIIGDLQRHKHEISNGEQVLYNYHLSMLFLMSSLCLSFMCKTARTIEAWNYILKRINHTEMQMRPDVFIRNHYLSWSCK